MALSQFTVPLLSRIYAAFDGDMVAALVLGEIAHRNVEAFLKQLADSEDPLYDPNRDNREALLRPCNALSIAEACHLPQPSCPAQGRTLTKRGFVYRNDKGYLYLTHNVGEHFEDMTAQIVERLLTTGCHAGGTAQGPAAVDGHPGGRVMPDIGAALTRTPARLDSKRRLPVPRRLLTVLT